MIQAQDFGVWPYLPHIVGSSPSTLLISGLTQRIGMVFRSPRTGNIAKLHFQWGSVNGSSTATFALQDVDGADAPDGTSDQTAASVTPTANAYQTADFSATPRAVTLGDQVAFVIGCSALGTNFGVHSNNAYVGSSQLDLNEAYALTYNGSAWSVNTTRVPNLAVEYSDGVIVPLLGAYPGSHTTTAVNTTSTPDEAGLYFRFPYPVRVIGAVAIIVATNSAPWEYVLYDAADNALGTIARGRVTTANALLAARRFPAAVDLAANTWYRLVIRPTSTTSVNVPYVVAATNAHLAGFPGGMDCHWTQRTDAGAWTQTDTRRPLLSLLVGGFEAGGSGGGLLLPRSMHGGYSA